MVMSSLFYHYGFYDLVTPWNYKSQDIKKTHRHYYKILIYGPNHCWAPFQSPVNYLIGIAKTNDYYDDCTTSFNTCETGFNGKIKRVWQLVGLDRIGWMFWWSFFYSRWHACDESPLASEGIKKADCPEAIWGKKIINIE